MKKSNLQLLKENLLKLITIFLIFFLASCNLFKNKKNTIVDNNGINNVIIDSTNIDFIKGIEKENIKINDSKQIVLDATSVLCSSSIPFLEKIIVYSNDTNYSLIVKENSKVINGNISKMDNIAKYTYYFTNDNSSFSFNTSSILTINYFEIYYKGDCKLTNSSLEFSNIEKERMNNDFNFEILFIKNNNYLLEFNKDKSFNYKAYNISKEKYNEYLQNCKDIYNSYSETKYTYYDNLIEIFYKYSTLNVFVKRQICEINNIDSILTLNDFLLYNYDFYINQIEKTSFIIDTTNYESNKYLKCYTDNINQITFNNYLKELYSNETINYQYSYNNKNITYYYFSNNAAYIKIAFNKEFLGLLSSCSLNIYIYLGIDVNEYNNLITNDNAGLPICDDNLYNVDLTNSKYIKKVSDQLSFIDSCPTTGNINILVIPVEFNDVKAIDRGFSINSINNAFNGSKSVSSYYKESSYGKLNITFDVMDKWYSPKYDSNYYINGEGSTINYHDNVLKNGEQIVINEILMQLDSEGFDLKKYDSDKNGYIDAVICIDTLNANKYVSTTSSKMYWAFCYYNYYLNKKTNKLYSYDNVSMLSYLWMSYDFLKETSNGKYDGNEDNIYTYIHEFGHVLGCIDYYDTTYDKDFCKCLDGYDVMDSMMGDHNPYSKMNYGWISDAKLLVANKPISLTLKSFTNTGDVLIIANNFIENLGIYQEYYIMVYYTNTNVNKKYGGYFNSNGVLVYKINASLMYYEQYNKYDVFFNNDSLSINNYQNLIRLIKNDKNDYLYTKNTYMNNEYKSDFPYDFYIMDDNDEEVKIVFNKK